MDATAHLTSQTLSEAHTSEARSQPPLPGPPRRVVVGEEVLLRGTTISACDRMSVKGRVEGTLVNCKQLEVAAGGAFTGSATVDEADISGEFSGRLRVKQLKARVSARIIGVVEYVTIEVERGAKISGELCSSDPDLERAKKTAVSAHAANARLL